MNKTFSTNLSTSAALSVSVTETNKAKIIQNSLGNAQNIACKEAEQQAFRYKSRYYEQKLYQQGS